MNQQTAVDTMDKKENRPSVCETEERQETPAPSKETSAKQIIIPVDLLRKQKSVQAMKEVSAAQRRRSKVPFSSIQALIREYDLTLDQLAGIWGVCRNTAGARIRDPGSITLHQLALLSTGAKIPFSEIREKIRR